MLRHLISFVMSADSTRVSRSEVLKHKECACALGHAAVTGIAVGLWGTVWCGPVSGDRPQARRVVARLCSLGVRVSAVL